jgi:hypothetical protein
MDRAPLATPNPLDKLSGLDAGAVGEKMPVLGPMFFIGPEVALYNEL